MGFLFMVQVFTVFGTWGVYFFFFCFLPKKGTNSLAQSKLSAFYFFCQGCEGRGIVLQ